MKIREIILKICNNILSKIESVVKKINPQAQPMFFYALWGVLIQENVKRILPNISPTNYLDLLDSTSRLDL